MRVLYVVPHPNSRAKSIAKYLSYDNHVVMVSTSLCWVPYNKIEEGKIFVGPQEFDNIIHISPLLNVKSQYFRLIISMPITIYKLIKLITRNKISLVLAYNPAPYSAFPSYIVSRLFHVPLVIDYVEKVGYTDQDKDFRGRLERFLVKHADAVLVLAECWAEYINSKWNVKQERIFHLPLGIDMQSVNYSFNTSKYSEEYGISKRPVIVYAGFTYPVKIRKCIIDLLDVERIMKAAPKVIEKYPNCKFIFLGPKSDERFTRLVQNLKIEKNVVMLGYYGLWSERHLSTMSLADCLIVTAANYRAVTLFPHNKCCDYLMMGKPIIAADTPALREMLQDTALFYKIEDESELAEKILYCLSHKEENKIKCEKGKKYFLENYTWEVLGKKLNNFLVTKFFNYNNNT